MKAAANPDEPVSVIIRLNQELTSTFDGMVDVHDLASFDVVPSAVNYDVRYQDAIAMRQAEAERSQANLLDWLSQRGIAGNGM